MVLRAISAISTVQEGELAIIQLASVLVLKVALEPTVENFPPHIAEISFRVNHILFVCP